MEPGVKFMCIHMSNPGELEEFTQHYYCYALHIQTECNPSIKSDF